MSRLGETIRNARIQAKMTEKALAKKCGMAEGVIKDIESGRRIVSDDQAQRILKILGVENPVSAELEVAQEPEAPLRPRPRPYKLPVSEPEPQPNGDNSAWLDALGGVVKRVPVTDENSVVIDHVLVPVVGGKIEGGAPDKVFPCSSWTASAPRARPTSSTGAASICKATTASLPRKPSPPPRRGCWPSA